MSNNSSKPTGSFWAIGIIALVWNLLGVSAYLMQAYMSEEILTALPAEEQALFANTPSWATAAYAIAVFSGAFAALLLLLKKKLSKLLFIVSFLGVLVQMYHSFFMSKNFEVYGPRASVMPIMIIIIGLFLIVYSRKADEKGWLS